MDCGTGLKAIHANAQVKSELQAARLKLRQYQTAILAGSTPTTNQAPISNADVSDGRTSHTGQQYSKKTAGNISKVPLPATSASNAQQHAESPEQQGYMAGPGRPLAAGISYNYTKTRGSAADSGSQADSVAARQSSFFVPETQLTSEAALNLLEPGHAAEGRTSPFNQEDCAEAQQGLDINDDQSCVICMEAPAQICFQPCGHAITCKACAGRVWAKTRECPFCRAPLQSLEQIGFCYSSAQPSPPTEFL